MYRWDDDMQDNVPKQANVNTNKYVEDCTIDMSVREGEFSTCKSP